MKRNDVLPLPLSRLADLVVIPAVDDDQHFSWSRCDGCGSTLGGDRHTVHVDVEGEWNDASVCTDCYYASANGVTDAVETRYHAHNIETEGWTHE